MSMCTSDSRCAGRAYSVRIVASGNNSDVVHSQVLVNALTGHVEDCHKDVPLSPHCGPHLERLAMCRVSRRTHCNSRCARWQSQDLLTR